MDNNLDLEKIILGIRHERTFSVSDYFGAMIDKLIPLQGYGLFPDECFQKVSHSHGAFNLRDREEESTFSLTCNWDGIVLDCDMLAEPKISISNVISMFNEIASVTLHMHEGINKINRIGVIHQYKFHSYQNAAKEILSRLFKIDMNGTPDTANFKMALKYPTSEALAAPEKKSDYKNAIISISSEKSEDEAYIPPDEIQLSVDYQRYYEPVRTLKDISIEKHVSEAEDYMKKNVEETELNFKASKTKNG